MDKEITKEALCRLQRNGRIISSKDGVKMKRYSLPNNNNYLVVATEKRINDFIAFKSLEVSQLGQRFLEIEIEASLYRGDPLYRIFKKLDVAIKMLEAISKEFEVLRNLGFIFPYRQRQHLELHKKLNTLIRDVWDTIRKDSDGKPLFNWTLKKVLGYDSPIGLDSRLLSS